MASSPSHRKLGPSRSPSPSKSPTPNHKHHPPPPPTSSAQFRPGVAVIVGVLTTIFSITFLILLYAKHCKRTNYSRNAAPNSATAPRNSGVDRSIVESLPLFRFGALQGQKDGLECAVCLGKFDLDELLRLLPKCKHAFHVECVDTWLDAHSTCPLCRNQVDPEDVLLVPDLINIANHNNNKSEEELDQDEETREVDANSIGCGFVRASGRHSSAGEKSSTGNLLQVVLQKPPPSRRRKSVDDGVLKSMVAPRKDLLLLTEKESEEMERRFGHRIIVSSGGGEGNVGLERWSDLRPSDLLFLRTEMIVDGGGRTSCSSGNGRSVAVNPRSQSEITGMSRREAGGGRRRTAEERTLRRWLSWIGNRRGGSSSNGPNS